MHSSLEHACLYKVYGMEDSSRACIRQLPIELWHESQIYCFGESVEFQAVWIPLRSCVEVYVDNVL